MKITTQLRFKDFLRSVQADFETKHRVFIQCGAELEFYLRPTGRTLSTQQLANCRQALVSAGVSVDFVAPETHPSQYEIAFSPLSDASELAGSLWATRAIISDHFFACGLVPTFLSKPIQSAPGSGLHIHVSLLDSRGVNLLTKTSSESVEPVMMQHTIEGLCQLMNESMPLFAPNKASYERYKYQSLEEEYRYSGAPTTISWGGNNRTVALRIPDYSGSPNSRRVEHRVPGADANPYLVLAAIIASIGYGIRNQLLLTRPKNWEDVIRYPDNLPRLVATITEARSAFAASGILRDLLFPLHRINLIDLLEPELLYYTSPLS